MGAFALGYGFVLVLLRGEPFVAGDQGVFLSVAARLLEGDRLYSEVFDNKDPLFFYTYAGGLWLAGWRGAFMLDALWLALASVGIALLLRELRAPRSALIAGFVVYPLALTAGWYLVGMSMLAGLAVAPFIPWLWLRARFEAAGAALAIVILLKLNLTPLAAAPLAALILLGAPEETRRRALLRGMLGLFGALSVAVLFLGIRGELRSYFETIDYNVYYSSARTAADGFLDRTEEHVRIAWDFFYLAGRWQAPLAILVLAAFGAAVILAGMRGARSERVLAGLGIVALLGAAAVVALTAYGEAHLQLLAYPATLVVSALIWRTDQLWGPRVGAVAATAVVLFSLWSSLKADGGTEVSSLWSARPISAGAIALERARARFHPEARRIDYMVLGSNSENGHAAFLGPEFDLSCRYFHLYFFSRPEQFDETLACARRETPMYVLVTLGFFEPAGHVPHWNAFVASSRQLLESRYELVEEEHPGFQVWKLRSV